VSDSSSGGTSGRSLDALVHLVQKGDCDENRALPWLAISWESQ